MLFQPWIAHWFPSAGGPNDMIELRWTVYLAMWDSLPDDVKNPSR